ncbi:MAG TPA: hypothetical protein VL100_09045 [Croceibacterium sp.]|nr:hypothetical protein [Croceibacterium sp.]
MAGLILQFAGSLAAVFLLVFVAWRLRLGGEPEIAGEMEARELAANALCGFEAAEIALDRAGRGALLRDSAGRIMLLAPHGNHFIGRLLDARTVARLHADRLEVAIGERRTATAALDVADAEAWCRAINSLD